MTQARDLVLWGATGQARVLAELIEGGDLRLAALIDGKVTQSPFPGVPLLRDEDALDRWLAGRNAGDIVGGVAVGGMHGRERLRLQALLAQRGLAIGTFVHRTAFVAADARIGRGSQVLAGAHVCANASLGAGVIVNTAASVDHDCEIGDGVHIGPGARLAGAIAIGDGAFVGTGAAIVPRVQIGADAVIGAGAVVIRSVPAGAVVAGNPARPIERGAGAAPGNAP